MKFLWNLVVRRECSSMKRNLSTLLTQTVKRVPSSGSTNSHQTVSDGSHVPETDSTSLSKENLRSRVYTLMRDIAKVPFASPPKPKRLSSNFEASCGLTRESSSTYNSFPESNHVLAALQIINDGISNDSVDKQSSGSKFSVLPRYQEYTMLRITKSLFLLWEGWSQLVTKPCLI